MRILYTTPLCLILWFIPGYSFGQFTGGDGKGDVVTASPETNLSTITFDAMYYGGNGRGDAIASGTENAYLTNKLFTGNSSTDFSLGANWVGGTFPANETAIVPPTATQQPVLSGSQTVTAGTTINILSGASLTVTPSGVLSVNGTLNNSGTLTLQSDATGTASIGNSSGSITGNAIVQRFVPAMASPGPTNSYGRRWRFISSPVQNSTLQDIRQEMHVTGTGTGTTMGTINSNGFDATYNNSPSVFRYNEAVSGASSNGWVSINHIDSVLVRGIGYRMFVRGDRSDTSRISRNSTTPQNAVTLDFRGVPNQGTVAVPLTFSPSTPPNTGDGWNMVGNPYPSAIDWNAIHDPGRTASGSGYTGTDYAQLYHSVYIYNPISNVYNSYNAESNTGTGALSSGIIASGQAFFVKATDVSPSLTLRESHKASSTTGLFKNINNSACRIQLIRDSFNRDEMCIKYLDGSTVNEDVYDTRLFPASVNVSAWGSDSVDLTISCRPTTTVNDTIRLNVVVPGSGSYTLRFDNSSTLAIQDHVTLIDTYIPTATNLMTQPNYTFSVNSSVPSSFGRSRFYIVVSNQNPVPVELIELKATAESKQRVRINWQSASEINFSHYEVEKSTDGTSFTPIEKLYGRGQGSSAANYVTWDNSATTLNYYRLKMVDKDATFTYSHTVVVATEEEKEATSQSVVFPNPGSGQFTLRTQLSGSYTLTDITGKEVESGRCESEHTFSHMHTGVYMLKLTLDTGKVEQTKVVVTK
jgi:hypothetical protein